jgi:5-(carboxyamino)imidazole ribonucleotide synthase
MGPLAILGGGQLARMTLQAASRLGIDVVIAERFEDSPAARLTSRSLVFPDGWSDPERLAQLASLAPVVTLESEFVDASVLHALEQHGARVLPSPSCVAVVQDKLWQKQALARAELPVPIFDEVNHPSELAQIGERLGWPLMLKARRDGYDGHGNVLVQSPDQADAACGKLGWPDRTLYAESFVPFERELAAMVVRGQDDAIAQYPIVDTLQDPALHICREVVAPADIPPSVANRAGAVAKSAVEAVDGVGAFGVEMFLLRDGEICINELAPRPHNSGHYSIEACWSSQFDNHVRAVLGLPLGDPSMLAPAAAMVNLLGTTADHVVEALSEPHAFIHLYGKTEARPGRKMGHVTALGATAQEAITRARRAAAHFTT